MVTMVIQFSILIVLHSCLVLVTTAEDYKCLPLVLRKACCWINETYAARNVIIFVSILINFLAAMINIVSTIQRRQIVEEKGECLFVLAESSFEIFHHLLQKEGS
ncbi:Adenylate cyclase type 8, partial [Xenoophorus captivus]